MQRTLTRMLYHILAILPCVQTPYSLSVYLSRYDTVTACFSWLMGGGKTSNDENTPSKTQKSVKI